MPSGTSRRRLLGRIAALSAVGGYATVAAGKDTEGRADEHAAESTDAGARGRREEFDPAVHGFGFRNWSTREQTYPEHDHDDVGEEQIRRAIGRRWDEPVENLLEVNVQGLPTALLDAIAKQVYVSVNQGSATNGHCYGMVFAAQQYYENPGGLPESHSTASEVRHPETPVGESDVAPVGKEIDLYQLTQFLNVHSWIGRRGMARPKWIDYGAQLEQLTGVLDRFGTAGITMFDAADRRAHQVLAYDYAQEADATRLFVYDPNYAAGRYANPDFRPAVEVDTSGDRPTVRRYNDSYDQFVFNRRDRIVAAQTAQGPAPLVARDGGRLRDVLFSLALFLVDSPSVSMTVVGPNDRPLRRDTATYMDRGRSAYSAMRYRYGFEPGTYRIKVVGTEATEYTLEALVSDHESKRLDDAVTRSIGAGEVHRYAADVPDSGTGSLEDDESVPSWLAALGGVGVAGVAAGGYAYRNCRSGEGVEKATLSDSERE